LILVIDIGEFFVLVVLIIGKFVVSVVVGF
jgi:hypothetical protein